MGALLVAAFTAVNALSLLYMSLIAVGMAAPPRARRVAWRFCSLPLLAMLLLLQYSVLIGLPPGISFIVEGVLAVSSRLDVSNIEAGAPHGLIHEDRSVQVRSGALSHVALLCIFVLMVEVDLLMLSDVWRHAQEWLGLDHVDARALWALFFAFSASVIQVSFGLIAHACGQQLYIVRMSVERL